IMSIENFKNISRSISPYTKLCTLHILGDPLSLDNLSEYLEVATKENLKIELTSSGFYLSKNIINLLLESPCIHQINISLMSSLYQNKIIDLKQYFAPILKLCTLHQNTKSEKFINLRLWNLNPDLTPPPCNQHIYKILQSSFNLTPFVFNDFHPKVRLGYKIFLTQAKQFKWSNLKNGSLFLTGSCYGGTKQLGILCDGRVVPCCFDTHGVITLGNILEHSLEEILQMQRAKNMIEGFKNNQRVESLCQACSYPNEKNNIKNLNQGYSINSKDSNSIQSPIKLH
ncbi:MAG: SPASM domain-containing protein, partial [Helicobacter sp.]|nr:SPASM domain-containing protein [Helicobacter sp.]